MNGNLSSDRGLDVLAQLRKVGRTWWSSLAPEGQAWTPAGIRQKCTWSTVHTKWRESSCWALLLPDPGAATSLMPGFPERNSRAQVVLGGAGEEQILLNLRVIYYVY